MGFLDFLNNFFSQDYYFLCDLDNWKFGSVVGYEEIPGEDMVYITFSPINSFSIQKYPKPLEKDFVRQFLKGSKEPGVPTKVLVINSGRSGGIVASWGDSNNEMVKQLTRERDMYKAENAQLKAAHLESTRNVEKTVSRAQKLVKRESGGGFSSFRSPFNGSSNNENNQPGQGGWSL